MYRGFFYVWFGILLVSGMAASAAGTSTAHVLIIGTVLIGGLLFVEIVARTRGAPSPLGVLSLVAAIVLLVGWGVYAMAQLGPLAAAGVAAGVVALAVLLTLWLKPNQARQWEEAGRCPGCGYDLRETPDRCPECGLPIPHSIERARRYRAAIAARREADARRYVDVPGEGPTPRDDVFQRRHRTLDTGNDR